jgi:acyl-CoA dehydrogenase
LGVSRVDSIAADSTDILAGVRAFLEAEVFPKRDAYEAELDKGHYGSDGLYSSELRSLMSSVRTASAEAGFYTMLLPEALGGAGLGHEAFFSTWEMIYRECGAVHPLGYQAVAHWSKGVSHLLVHASEDLRQRVLPDLLNGRKTICFAMSEPNAGSDTWSMQTRAERAGGTRWKLNGMKQWISNGPLADYALIFAVTNTEMLKAHRGGVTAFFVETDTPGFSVDSVIRMFGQAGGDEAILSFQDLVVDEGVIVGEVHQGLALAFAGVSAGRLYNTARAVGLGNWALSVALKYACDRETFGAPIISNQGVSFPLVDAAAALHSARLVGIDCARLLDAGRPARAELNVSKLLATESALRAIDTAMQTCGAIGFTNEMHLFDAWVQARKICIADGSSEILRRSIAKSMRNGIFAP